MIEKLQSLYNTVPSELYDDPTVIAGPIFALIILTEVLISRRNRKDLYEFKDSAASFGTSIGVVLIGSVTKTLAFLVMFAIYQHRIFDFDFGIWWYWVLLFFMEDFSFYWHHRLSHQIRVLWAAHMNHHSSQKLNYTVAIRQSWVEICYKYVFWLWLPLLGFHPIHVLLFQACNAVFQFWPHTQLIRKVGIIEWVFNTPSHHRVHHSSNPIYLDRNHAGILIIWDRMFGTFQKELDEEPCVYGITNNITTFNPLKFQALGYIDLWKDIARADSFKDKLNYLFKPPGWSHDGPDRTSDTIRKLAKEGRSS